MHFNKILKHTIAWKLINTALVFLINLLMVRLLGVSESGTFFYDIAVLSFLVLIISWSLESGITYYCSRDNRNIASTMVVILPILLVDALVMEIALRYIAFSLNDYLSIVFVIGNIAIMYFSAFFSAKKWFIPLNIIICCINFVTAILLFYWWAGIAAIVPGNSYFIITYIFSFTAQALLLALIMLYSIKDTRISFTDVKPVVKKIFTYSSIAFISNVVFFLVTRIDYFFVQKYCTTIALSNYVQVSKFGQLLILVPSIIAGIVFPYSAAAIDEIPLAKVQQLCRVITLIFIPVAIIVIVTGSWVLPWLFGNGFNFMYTALLFYLPGFFSLSILTVLAANLAGKKLLKVNLLASIIALLIVVTGDFLLIPVGGINIAAAVSSIAYTACCFYLLWFYKNRFYCSMIDFFSLKKDDINILLNHLKKNIT